MKMSLPDQSVIEILREKQLISEEDYEKILLELENKSSGENGTVIDNVLEKYTSRENVELARKSLNYGIEFVNLANVSIDEETISKMTASFAYKNHVIPVKFEDGVLTVAMGDPLDVILLDEIRLVTECEVEPLLANSDQINEAITEFYGQKADKILSKGLEGPVGVIATEGREAIDDYGLDIEALTRDPTVVEAINQIIIDAVRDEVSDIHIEPFQERVRIRYRKDGVLQEIPPPPKHLQAAIISRVKIMADMNIAEKRRPQDGNISLEIRSLGAREIDLRVSTVPTIWGESVVMRILDKKTIAYSLEKLGLLEDNLKQFYRLIRKPHGIILATGPTGSGKTTSLYACLRKINTPEVKIITVEEPVEYDLEGINQIPVNKAIDVTFAKALRHILRQDPDVILVGEIRDEETAAMATHSALTGHLVFSSLHTNDASGAIPRMIDMGIAPYLVASTIEGIVAQRLVRRVCKNCCEMYHPEPEEIRELFGSKAAQIDEDLMIPRAVGCDECKGTGYTGQIGIFEVVVMNERLREMTLANASASQIKRAAMSMGMKTLRGDGWRKVVRGITTIDEVMRVTMEDEFEVDEAFQLTTDD